MSSKIPKSLKEISAFEVALQRYVTLVIYFIEIFHPDHIPESNFIPEENQLIEFETRFQEILNELAALSSSYVFLRSYIEKALERIINEATTFYLQSELYIPGLMLKFRMSVEAFNDKDFCYHHFAPSIPNRLETLTKFIIRRNDNNDLRKLVIFKKLNPSITEQILYSSKNITYLSFSYANITSELLISVGKICIHLESLHLNHFDLWGCVSVDSIYMCFFKGYSRELLQTLFLRRGRDYIYRTNFLSFPHLRHTTIAFNDFTLPSVIFHRWLLVNYYKNLESLWQNCFIKYFDLHSYQHTRMVLIEMARYQHIIKLRSLVLPISLLSDMLPFQFLKVLKMMPFLKTVYIGFSQELDKYDLRIRKMNDNLQLLWKHAKINEVYLTDVTQDSLFKILDTVPKECCDKITSITVSDTLFPIGKLVTKFLFLRFTYLKQITFSKCSILGDEMNDCYFACLENLLELHISDTYSGSICNLIPTRRFIMAIIRAAPNLELLSIGVNRELLLEITNIEMPVLVLHLKFMPTLSDQDDISHCVLNFLNKLNRLKTLYLEEINSVSFFFILRYFRNSNLIVKLGGLHGLPKEIL